MATTKKKSELTRIAAELQRAYNGDAWHGPAITVTLKGVPAFRASSKPIPQAHSIWEIVRHLTAWNHIVRRRFLGELVKVSPEQDWPPLEDMSNEAWDSDLSALEEACLALVSALKKHSRKSGGDAVLNRRVRGKTHNVYVMLHGAVQHNLYHAGQISILRKAME
jgi:uncharacterized damage-inducible protein DinB